MAIVSEKVIKLVISTGEKRKRIDSFLANTLENTTRSRIQKLIKEQCLTVNGEVVKANYIIEPKDEVILTIPVAPRPDKIEPENIPLQIVYEDEYLMVIDKPAGMVVHPSPGNYSGTLVHALKFYTNELSSNYGDARSGIIHRIDKDTSGLLVIAKDENVHSNLAKQFAAHSTEREYWAICWGKFKNSTGEITGNIARSNKDRKIFSVSENEGRHAQTYYEVLEEFDFLSLIKLRLKTGRTHQIRVHLSHIKHNIFGDHTYGGRRINYGFEIPKIKATVNNLLKLIDRQTLHAKTLGFIHPITNEKMSFNSDLPEDFENLLTALRNLN
ncbi:MAG: RluA family pseudouridine synthase [Ignavibacteriales bacterium]|nr:RluA family pseudouridine synthase [Ignavibacteriales bacterium]MCB9217951.1 RluA family pseudouridine synthase [Ignavibacteriales bacterium]MCB9260340.1 RluA family pseudouridine synthase [Ignavibacteriales bacterium]